MPTEPVATPQGSQPPSVEVVLCTYNGAAYLQQQLNSILQQSRGVNRISVFDDGSTDGTAALVRDTVLSCQAGGRPAPDITLHVNPVNLGFAANFSQALSQASQDVVFLCDQDDVWEPHKVQLLLGLMATTGAAMVFSDGSLIDAQGQPLAGPSVLASYGLDAVAARGFAGQAAQRLVRRNYVNGAACAVERRLLEAALPVPPGLPHDYWLALWAAAQGRLSASAERLYRYRQHAHNVIGIGRGPVHWQWAAIWRDPRRPRLREIDYCRAALPRLQAGGGELVQLLTLKLHWLEACAGQPGRWARLRGILQAWFAGDYRRFGTPHALLRDVVGVVRQAG